MKLINKTTKQVIATKIITRKKRYELILGLIPYKIKNKYVWDYLKFKKFSKNDSMLFKVRGKSGIHTWFMSFPIDVCFLDKDMKVIEKVDLEPFTSYKPKREYESFIEMNKSKVNEISLGDKLELE